MNFLEKIFERLRAEPGRTEIEEIRDGRLVPVSAGDLLGMVSQAGAFFRRAGLMKGDRCALLANNSARWVAADLALMAGGIVVVPLYARQAPNELVRMMKDCTAALVCCGDDALAEGVRREWPEGRPPIHTFDEVFAAPAPPEEVIPPALADSDLVTIIYTSGTSGEPKGVMLDVANVSFMVPRTTGRLDVLMGPRSEPDRIFHYLPCCFAGSWILLLTALSRNSVLTLSMDLAKLADEMKLAAPNYFLNVPALLERVRAGVEDQIAKKGGVARVLYTRGRQAWMRRYEGKAGGMDGVWEALAARVVFKTIRAKLGPQLRALICGSAPLARETQLFFQMIGLPVLQVYGLTETTAICTMDHPARGATPGRVGPAIDGIEMKVVEGGEIAVRGPNIFPGYWNRPEETARVLRDGWFYTGDQGDANGAGNWAIIGRTKNLLVLNSGHKVPPEPLEEALARKIHGAQQVVVVGDKRSFLAALIAGNGVSRVEAEAAIEEVNRALPHYKRVHAYHLVGEPLTIESGLLTANGKLRRDAIAQRFSAEIEALYARRSSGAGA